MDRLNLKQTTRLAALMLLVVALSGCGALLRAAVITPMLESVDQPEFRFDALVTAKRVGRDGCPVNTTATFDPSDAIYIVATGSDVPAGTDIFVRLYYEDQPLEDSVVITADQDYADTCVYIVFETTSAAIGMAQGSYEAQLIVDGNPKASIPFEVE